MPTTITYEEELDNFRNEVNRKFSSEMGEGSHTKKSINKTSRKYYRGNINGKSGGGVS